MRELKRTTVVDALHHGLVRHVVGHCVPHRAVGRAHPLAFRIAGYPLEDILGKQLAKHVKVLRTGPIRLEFVVEPEPST